MRYKFFLRLLFFVLLLSFLFSFYCFGLNKLDLLTLISHSTLHWDQDDVQYSGSVEVLEFSDDIFYSIPNSTGSSYNNITFSALGLDVSSGSISSTSVNLDIPFDILIPAGYNLQIPILFAADSNFSLSSVLNSINVQLDNSNYSVSFAFTLLGYSNFNVFYYGSVYTDNLDLYINDFSFLSKLCFLNVYNDSDVSKVLRSINFSFDGEGFKNRVKYILFPFYSEDDDIFFLSPANLNNVPILNDILSILSDVSANILTGNTNNASHFNQVISLLQSLDTNVSIIDDRVYSIVQRLQAINTTLNYISADVSQTNQTLSRIASMLTDIYNPSIAFSLIIEQNHDYLEDQQEVIESLDQANQDKTGIYDTSISGLTSSGGTFDNVSSYVDNASQDQMFNGVFGVIFNNQTIITLFTMVIALGTVGYILYGKH